MTVYVDPVRPHVLDRASRVGRLGNRWCHLLAIERGEIHAFAAVLSLRRAWLQDHPWSWHYDLTASKRRQALLRGAVAIEHPAVGHLLVAASQRPRAHSVRTPRSRSVTTIRSWTSAGVPEAMGTVTSALASASSA